MYHSRHCHCRHRRHRRHRLRSYHSPLSSSSLRLGRIVVMSVYSTATAMQQQATQHNDRTRKKQSTRMSRVTNNFSTVLLFDRKAF